MTEEKVFVIKSDGRKQLFSESKLVSALSKAQVPEQHVKPVIDSIKSKIYDNVPAKEIRKWVIGELDKINPEYSHGFNYKKTAVYVVGGMSFADLKDTYQSFTKKRIIDSLLEETGMPLELAEMVANKAEHFLIENNLKFITGPIIREIVNYFLLEEGLLKYYYNYLKIGLPVYDITKLIKTGSKENANQQYNPETIHKLIADNIVRPYSLTTVLPKLIADAHINGEIHIHDLDYFPLRPFCFSHDLRFFLKNGLKVDGNGLHTCTAGPARSANVAILHAAKILASGQVNCAGGQGFNWFNIILAPYLKGMSYKEIEQLAQMFIYEMSTMYVSRGGQVVFSSIDVEPDIPKILQDVPAVLPGGIVKENVTYGDFADEALQFFNGFLDVYTHGDYNKKPFSWPKFEAKIKKDDFEKHPDEMLKLAALSAKFGTPYYFIQQDYLPEYSCYQCCSYLMPLSDQNSRQDLINGTVRGGAIQVVSINLPKAAYDARSDETRMFEIIDERMEKAKRVMEVKQEIMRERQKQGILPFISQPINKQGEPYFEIDKQSCTIGIVGLNEMVKSFLGSELHESNEAWEFGLKTIMKMKDTIARFKNETGKRYSLSRTPAESAAYRFASLDLARYQDKAVVQGDRKTGNVYYTNSTHIRPSADVALSQRIIKEAAFHPLLDGGAMSHIWLDEASPNPEALNSLTKKIATKTLMSYFAYTADLTICNTCMHVTGGMLKKCPKCGSEQVDWLSRITGYYQRVSSWNKGKQQEFLDRKRYSSEGIKNA